MLSCCICNVGYEMYRQDNLKHKKIQANQKGFVFLSPEEISREY